jgi:hypothetical protein
LAAALVWALLILHPNVPDLTTGLLGFRKSALVFVALALGLYTPRERAPQLLRMAHTALVVLGISAAVVHLAFPGFEQGLPRAADAVTSTFGGRPRLQGLLPGPFHAAILGAFLFLAAAYRYLLGVRERAVMVGGTVGILLVALAQVRAGYVAAIVGFVCILILSARRRERSPGRWMMVSLVGLLVGAALLSGAAASGDAALDSLRSPQTIASDQRFAARFVAWGGASDLFLDSPLLGWGTGSAGDTLGDRFVGRRHVSSHNALLKYLVEGGLIGVGMIVVVVARARSLARSVQGALPLTTAAVLTGVIAGLTTPVSEAVPVSTTIMLLVGLELRSSRS